MVPQPDNTLVAITHLGVSEASQTLGSISAPSGDLTLALMRVKEKAQGWIDTAKKCKTVVMSFIVPSGPAVLAKGGLWGRNNLGVF